MIAVLSAVRLEMEGYARGDDERDVAVKWEEWEEKTKRRRIVV